MAVSKSYLCNRICEMAGHTRKNRKLTGFTKKELLILFSFLHLTKDKQTQSINVELPKFKI